MSTSTTHQLADAVARLAPADRALYALAVDRGLPDARIAVLTGIDPELVAARRERVLDELAAALAVPRLTFDAEPHRPTVASPRPSPPPTPALAPRRRRRVPTLAVGLLVVLVAALGVGLALGGGGSSTARRALTRHATPTGPPAAAAPPAAPARLRPVALPGAPSHATGSLALRRRGAALILDVRVSGLPRARRGHYEAYLYDSLLDSRALGRVRDGALERFVLPPDAARYDDIDVSLQPRGAVNPSGRSRLRAANPARQRGRGSPSRKRSTR